MLERIRFGMIQPLPEEILYELMDLMEAAPRTGSTEMAPKTFTSIAINLLGREVEKLPSDAIKLEINPQTTSSYRITRFNEERVLSSFQLRNLVPHKNFKEFKEVKEAGLGDLKWFLIFTKSGTHFCQFDEAENCWYSTTLKVSLQPEAGKRWPKLMATFLEIPLKQNLFPEDKERK